MSPVSIIWYMLGVLFCILVFSTGLYAKECHKVNQCKCVFDDGSGSLDLTSLGKQDETPLIKDQVVGDYAYSFNPCYGFTEGSSGGCVGVAGCQVDKATSFAYSIGDAASVNFTYDGVNVIGTYKHTDEIAVERKSVVTFICDASATSPILEALGEVSLAVYAFTIKSNKLCPNTPTKGTCNKVDQCKCKFGDGAVVDLGTIGRKDGIPLFRDVPAPDGHLYSYNPCYSFSEKACKDVALCQMVTDSLYYEIGDEKSNEFFYDGANLFVRYSSTTDRITRTSVVTFVCDPAATTPSIRALGEVAEAEYDFYFNETGSINLSLDINLIFTVTTSAACPQSAPTCDKVDNCKCTMSDGSGTLDLSNLGKQDGPLMEKTLSDAISKDMRYAFSYNPCYPFTEGTCANKSACLLDIVKGQYYDIGSPEVDFSYDGANVIGTYTASDNVRGSRVTFVCNQTAVSPTVDILGELAPSVYGFRVTSRQACT